MSEEEKDLVDFLYRLIEQGTHKIYDDDLHDRKICEYINLISKQQKEIERLQRIKAIDIKKMIDEEKVNIYKNYISKQKIIDKIEELKENKEDFYFYCCSEDIRKTVRNILEQLLEEGE